MTGSPVRLHNVRFKVIKTIDVKNVLEKIKTVKKR